MNFNPAQQNAHGILSEAAMRISRELVRKGAAAFFNPDYYQRWRDWCHNFISERLANTYGSHALEQNSEQRWIWQILPEYANLCHNLPFVTLAMLRIQQEQPSDLVIVQPIGSDYIAAALGSGCHTHNSRARVSKLREPSSAMLYAGEGLPGMQRNFGSPLLEIAMVANGELDAACWDQLSGFLCLAAKLMLSESGGMASNKKGDPLSADRTRDSLLIANPGLHARLAPLVDN